MNLEEEVKRIKWHETKYISPHAYIKRTEYPGLFRELVKAIDEKGYKRKFKGVTYRYLDIGDYSYWHFNLILNRAKMPRPKAVQLTCL